MVDRNRSLPFNILIQSGVDQKCQQNEVKYLHEMGYAFKYVACLRGEKKFEPRGNYAICCFDIWGKDYCSFFFFGTRQNCFLKRLN